MFHRGVYCRSRAGFLVWFGPLSVGNGPLNVRCLMPGSIHWEDLYLRRGSRAACDGANFRIGGCLAVSLSEADVWRPAMPPVAWQAAAAIESLTFLERAVHAWPARDGLQTLIPMLIGDPANSPVALRAAKPLIRMALDGITPLRAWLETCVTCPSEPSPVPVSALDALLGLGPGLTPSGDDFLGGALLALRHLGAPLAADKLAAAVLARAGQRTNEISRAHLAAASGGEGAAPLHDALSSLFGPGFAGMESCLSAVDAIGHTSGWDALAGIALVAATMARARMGGVGSASPRDGPAEWGMHVA